MEKNIEVIGVANRMGIRIEFIEKNSLKSVKDFLRKARKVLTTEVMINYAKLEEYIQRVFDENRVVELPPADSNTLAEEQAFISRYDLHSEIVGLDPNRRLVIYPNRRK